MGSKDLKPDTSPETKTTDSANEPQSAVVPEKTGKQTKVAEKQAKPAEPEGGFCVYLGPSIHGAILNGTVYSTNRQATLMELESIIEKYPLVATLIVTGEELPESRIKIKTPGNLLNANYARFVGELKRQGGQK